MPGPLGSSNLVGPFTEDSMYRAHQTVHTHTDGVSRQFRAPISGSCQIANLYRVLAGSGFLINVFEVGPETDLEKILFVKFIFAIYQTGSLCVGMVASGYGTGWST